MIIAKIYRFACGYVRFSAVGESPEEILNAFSHCGADVWDMRRVGSEIEASVKLQSYKKIRTIRGKNARTKVIKRIGVPFLIRRYRHRTGLLAGFILFIAALAILPNFIWNVQIVGNEAIPSGTIYEALAELGVREGVPRKSIDSGEIRAKLPLKVGGISWASVNVEGVRATAEISEAVEHEAKEKPPCNLVALRDGIITKTEVINGALVTGPGVSVAKGQLLVSGVVEYKNQTSAFKAAEGVIAARTNRTFSVFVPLKNTKTVKTGKTQKRCVVSFLGADIPLFIGNVSGDYIKKDSCYVYSKNDMYIPIKFYNSTFYKTKQNHYTLTENEAIKLAEQKLNEFIENDKRILGVISSQDSITVNHEGVTVIRKAVVEENIAEEVLLLFNSQEEQHKN